MTRASWSSAFGPVSLFFFLFLTFNILTLITCPTERTVRSPSVAENDMVYCTVWVVRGLHLGFWNPCSLLWAHLVYISDKATIRIRLDIFCHHHFLNQNAAWWVFSPSAERTLGNIIIRSDIKLFELCKNKGHASVQKDIRFSSPHSSSRRGPCHRMRKGWSFVDSTRILMGLESIFVSSYPFQVKFEPFEPRRKSASNGAVIVVKGWNLYDTARCSWKHFLAKIMLSSSSAPDYTKKGEEEAT